MVHKAIDADPLAPTLMDQIPRPLRKRLPPREAGEAIAAGIEQRRPRIIRPRRWAVLSVLRGILNPLTDAQAERDATMHAVVTELDGRATEEQTTTA